MSSSRKSTDNEKKLIERARKGDKEAYEMLVEMYSQKVMTTLYYRTGNREEAEDLSQEVFIKAYRGIRNFKGEASFSTWLWRIVHNVSASYFAFRSAKKRDAVVVSLDRNKVSEAKVVSNDLSRPDDLLLSSELREMIELAIQSLTPEMRELVVLRDIEDKSYEDISDILNTPVGTVKSRIHRGRVLLRDKLKRYL